VKNLGRTYYKLKPRDCLGVAVLVAGCVVRKGGDKASEWREQVKLLRDLLGNPFRPVVIEQAWLRWREGTVVNLAQAIYDDRAFDRLPILADALEEAGCTNPDLVAHCRSPGPHVRGCWAVDAILGKE